MALDVCDVCSLDNILNRAIEIGATDIHLEEEALVYMRVGNDLIYQELLFCHETIFEEIFSRCQIGEFVVGAVDEAFSFENIRVRVHIYRCQNKYCGTLRILYNHSLDLHADDHYQLLQAACSMQEGLILITGPTGSGKTYTLASCIEYINQNFDKHIVTLEDPIEFVFDNKKSLIHQRQLGLDIVSMASGVKDSLREDPDVIMVGELRDYETLKAALHAAETGHLVLATMHTQRAPMAINRMLSMFPSEEQEEARNQLSQVLRLIICQRLLVIEGHFINIRDILLNTVAVANLIRQKKEPLIYSIQETNSPMQTMEMSIKDVKKKWGDIEAFRKVVGITDEAISM